MRFRVLPGMTVQRGPATHTEGEEFEATGDEAQDLLRSDLVERVDEPQKKTDTH